MRPIEFRAWDKINKKYEYLPNPFEYSAFSLLEGKCVQYILEQFTGLTDMDGKEIYEGDIVAASIYTDEPDSNLPVYFLNGAFVIDYRDSESDCCCIGDFVGLIKVIGNIHENPELI